MGIKYKDPTTGQFKDISVKVADSLPIGTEVDYDGETVPTGWEEITEFKRVNTSDYLTFNTTSIDATVYKSGSLLYVQITGRGSFVKGENVIGSSTNKILAWGWGQGRCKISAASYTSARPITIFVGDTGEVRICIAEDAAIEFVGTIILLAKD